MKQLNYFGLSLLAFICIIAVDFVKNMNPYLKVGIVLIIAIASMLVLFEYQANNGHGIWKIFKAKLY